MRGTGTRSVWRGGTGPAFSVASLSWTADGRQLVYLGQSCRSLQLDSEVCAHGGRTAEVRALNPAAGGGRLDSGPVLLRQSARYPYIAQAQISPDGTTITAVVLTGRMSSSHQVPDMAPEDLSVIQVSRSSRQPLRVLYQRNLGRTTEINTGPDFLQLSQDGSGQHWMLNGGLPAPGLHGRVQRLAARRAPGAAAAGDRPGGQRGLVTARRLAADAPQDRMAARRPAHHGLGGARLALPQGSGQRAYRGHSRGVSRSPPPPHGPCR